MILNQTPTRHCVAALLLALATAASSAQVATQPAVPAQPQSPTTTASAPVHHRAPRPEQPAFTNPNVIVLNPAHGGTLNGAADNGATFPSGVLEKDVTLAFAGRLRSALTAQGFTVVMTRQNATDDVPQDARVELANRSHALACLILHAANGGHGVHLYTSSMQARPALLPGDQTIQPWDTAQAAALPQSARLLADLGSSLSGLRLPLVSGQASVKPIDSLSCPAVAVEIAPLGGKDSDQTTTVTDAAYQQRIADSVTQALVFWRGHWQTPAMLQAQTAAQAQAQAQAAAAQKAANQRAAAEKRLARQQALQSPGTQPANPPATQPATAHPPASNPAQPRVSQPTTSQPVPKAGPQTRPAAAPANPAAVPKARPRIVDPDAMIVGDPVPVTQPAARRPAPIVRKAPPANTTPQVRP